MPVASLSALKLSGFLLAHALWIVSDLKQGEAYVPQALCERIDGQRELVVFEAESQAEAIARGKAFLANEGASFARCAFARDGQISTNEGYVDVLTIDLLERELPARLTIIQPYRRSERLALLGDELLATPSGRLTRSEEREARFQLRAGALEHDGAAPLWNGLDSNRMERPTLFK